MGLAQSIEQAKRYIDRGEINAAEAITRRLRSNSRGNLELQFLDGCIRYKKGDYAGAIELFRQVVNQSPDDINARVNLGVALIDAGAPAEAVGHLQQALAQRPDHFIAWYNLGNACRTLERYAEARQAYLRAIACKPGYYPAHNNLGFVSNKLGLADDAIRAYRTAIDLHPAPDFYINLLHLLKRRDADQTHALMREATDRFDDPELLACVFPSAVNLCAWPLTERIRGRVLAYAQAPDAKPGVLQDLLLPLNACAGIAPATLLAIHRNWARRSGGAELAAPGGFHAPVVDGRLRVAYLSGDFNGHAVGLFMRHVLVNHDRSRFEIVCYSTSGQKDDATREMERRVDAFVDVSTLDDVALARRISEDGIHLLVDLSGHTLNTRIAVLRHRSAPVQVTYLGYPNTTGLKEADYRITDGHAEAAGGTRYTERLALLPESFLCFGSFAERPRAAAPPALSQGYVTFGSFNHTRKLTPEAVRLWSDILQQVPGSRLLIKASLAGEACVQDNLYRAFAAEGIGRERVELRGFTATRESHLDCYNEVDIALDTFPYNGTTTTCEALWMGVPVVTLAGKVHAQRVTYSILKNIGVEETIAWTEAEYAAIAVGLARDHKALAALRARIPGALRGSILCDPARFTRQLEQLYRELWREKAGALLQGVKPARPGGWVDHVQDKPYVAPLLSSWLGYMEHKADTEHWLVQQQAMDLYFEAQAGDIDARRMKLACACRLLSQSMQSQPGLSTAQSFVRIAVELGETEQAMAVVQELIGQVLAQDAVDLSEPFLPVLAGYEQVAPRGELKWWVLAALLELRDRLLAGGAEYADGDAVEALELIGGLGYRNAYVDERCRALALHPADGPTSQTEVAASVQTPGSAVDAGGAPALLAATVCDRSPQQRPIRLLHNLARSGGTLLARCLACMQDIVLLSEIHPKGSARFNPLAQAQDWHQLFDEQELQWMRAEGRMNFVRQLDLIERRCHELGRHLVVRDWAHVDFHAVPFSPQPCYEFTTSNVLEYSGLFRLSRVAVTRHPIDQWGSLSRLTLMRDRLTFEDFLSGYRRYVEQCAQIGFVRYEDFVAQPEAAMQRLCAQLELPYDGRFMHAWSRYDKITGDMGAVRSAREIRPVSRRRLSAAQLERFARNADYRVALEMLGYRHPR